MRAFPQRSLQLLVVLVSVVGGLSCGGGSDGGGPPEPSSVVVTPGTDTLFAIDATQQYTAAILDDDGDPVDGAVVSWSSSDNAIVTIDAVTGLATAKKNGQATISAHVGDLQGSAVAFVAQIVTTVTVTPGNAFLDGVGDTVRFSASAKDAGGTVVAEAQVIWSINDNTVATIDSLGLARAKGPGTVLVTALAQTRAGFAALGVTQAPATLVFNSAPSAGAAGATFTTGVQVEIRDSNGHRARNGQLPVTVSVVGGAGPGGMVGVNVLTTTDGIATFQNLGVTKAGSIQLVATAPGIAQATTAAFPVTPDLPAQLGVIDLPDTMVAGDTLKATIAVQDRFGNQTDADGVQINFQLRRERSPGVYDTLGLDGQQFGTAVDGILDKFYARLNQAGSGYELIAWTATFDTTAGGDATIIPGAPVFTAMWFTGTEAISPWIGVGTPRSLGLKGFVTDQMLNIAPTTPPTTLTVELVSWEYGTPADTAVAQQVGGTLSGLTAAGIADLPAVSLRRPGLVRLRLTGGGYFPLEWEQTGKIHGKHNIVTGSKHACLLGGGVPICWGDNAFGQIGGTGARDSVARPVPGAPQLVSITAGRDFNCGLTAAGEAWCWGRNASGQLGRNSSSAVEPLPLPVVTALTFSSISAGVSHVCAVSKADSTAHCWGLNNAGQLGDSTMSTALTPVPVKGGHKFVQISVGSSHSCGVIAGPLGEARCWGSNGNGRGGTGSMTPTNLWLPTPVMEDSILAIRASIGFTCAEKRSSVGDVRAWCWGIAGRLGDTTSTDRATPQPISTVTAITPGTLTTGYLHACVMNSLRQPFCWGSNSQEEIKDGGGTFADPWQLALSATAVGGEIAAGENLTCIIYPPSGFGVTFGRTVCVGRPNEGQLGVGYTSIPIIWGTEADQ
jgi:alpha-tubulin suppressor-like RCC1 family protein/uncharacterized protein YjdB